MIQKFLQKVEQLWRDFGPEEQFNEPDSLRVARYGTWVASIGFGGFLLWALFVPLAEGVVAFGALEADGNRKTIQHLEGGIVTDIKVEEGDSVDAGQLLLSLDKTQAEARLQVMETRYVSTLASLDRLAAERLNVPKITWTEPLAADVDQSLINDVRQSQTSLFTARQEQLAGEINILHEKRKQLERQKTGLEAELAAKQEELGFIEDELERLERLSKRGTVDLPRLLAQKKAKSQAVGAIARVQTEISAAEIGAGEAMLQITQLTYNRRQEIETSAMELQDELFEVLEELASAKDIYRRTEVYAPQTGKVLGLKLFTIGGVVPPGEALMDIVPETGLIVRGRVRPTDADNVTASMPARIRLSGLNQRTTPELNAIVTDVSGDAKVDEVTGESYFEISLSIPPEELARVTDSSLIPGMPVEIMVEAGSRTAMAYFIDPITDIIRRSMREE